eukprot:m.113273 g.113273  ORF g.113273 m.113273 type:complete len:63 (-) comp13508_c0_seq1:7-195(-)
MTLLVKRQTTKHRCHLLAKHQPEHNHTYTNDKAHFNHCKAALRYNTTQITAPCSLSLLTAYL